MVQCSIQIIEENDFLLVLNKPVGFSVHNQKPSVSDFLEQNKKPLHFVNRLDQETSGLMVVAKTPALHQSIANSLDLGQKIYRALLRSPWKNTATELVWNWSLTDKAEGRQNPQGLASDRKPAETRVKILRSNQYFTEIQAEILTGRQHQIRKHAALAKHPIVGDKRYNEEKYNNNINKFYQNERMLLHAEKLEFSFQGQNYKYFVPFSLDVFFV